MTGMIDIQEVTEHEDGSATIVFECDDQAKKALIGEGLLSLLDKAVDKHNEEYNGIEGVENEGTRTED